MPITAQPYTKDAGAYFGPVMIPGESYAFYMNIDGGISDPAFDDFRLDIMNDVGGQVVATGIGTLEKDVINAFFYNIMCSFVCPALPFGWYRLVIRDTAAGTVKAVSNTINIEEWDVVKDTTSLIAYRHAENKYGFRYEENPTFYNRVRVAVLQVDYKIESDRTNYRNVSNRKLRVISNYSDKLVTLESQNFNEFGHDAMNALYDHNTVFVNNHFIITKGEYGTENTRGSAFSKGSIDAYVDYSVLPPAQAITPDEYLVTSDTMEEITANGEQILITY